MWQQKAQVGKQPDLSINSWLLMVRKMQVLSTFPRLSSLEATAALKFTGQEHIEKHWVERESGKLYALQETHSPYELHIKDICASSNCTKLAAFCEVMETWEKNEKAVFFTMGPTNALILYWIGFI